MIKEGCMAVVTGGLVKENIGKLVTVGKYIGCIDEYDFDDYWEVDTPMEDSEGDEVYFQREVSLSKIDDIDESLAENSEEL